MGQGENPIVTAVLRRGQGRTQAAWVVIIHLTGPQPLETWIPGGFLHSDEQQNDLGILAEMQIPGPCFWGPRVIGMGQGQDCAF